MKNLMKALTAFSISGASLLFALLLYTQPATSDNLITGTCEKFTLSGKLSLIFSQEEPLLPGGADANESAQPHGQPAREAAVYTETRMVTPGGHPFGIKLHTEGVLVVGMTDIQSGSALLNPAKEAGIKVGDVLISIDGQKLERGCDVRSMVSGSGGQPLSFTLRRGEQELSLTLVPVLSEFDNAYKAGFWVRDSSAGIGTMTYFDPVSGAFAGLGHAVCDIDTGAIMPLASGKIVDVNISGINAGQSGRPGELKGTFLSGRPLGELHINSEAGLFGLLSASFLSHDPIPMARKQQVEPGPAVIFSTISGNKPQSFDITIEKVNHTDTSPSKNMVIRVNDDRLLSATGGIVQGMSGSPIIQNGKLVGAVTHVFVNDPSRGYGIFAENMDKQLKMIENSRFVA